MMLDSSTYIENLWKVEKIELNDNDIETKLQAFLEKMTTDFKQVYDDKETLLNNLEIKINTTEDIFKSGLESKSQKLNDIHIQVKAAIHKFKQASENAVRIGDRLASTENERKILVRTIDIIKTIDCLQRINPIVFQDILQDSLNFITLKNSLSETLRKKDIRSFCSLLLDLRKVLIDIKSDQVSNAQINIIALSQFVESELLDEFESCITKLTQYTIHNDNNNSNDVNATSPNQSSSSTTTNNSNEIQILRQTQDLAECLYYFGEGDALEKRYLFSVVQVMFRQSDTRNGSSGNNRSYSNNNYSDEDDDEDNGDDDIQKPRVDLLSQLFGNISNICKQQFEVIAKVFPIRWGYRVMRLLVLRIFNDPAFGIQTYIDSSLYPASPQPPLSLGEYLNMLGNVREKLSAFHIILADYCVTYGFIDDVSCGNNSSCISNSSASSGYDHYHHNDIITSSIVDATSSYTQDYLKDEYNNTTNDDGTFSVKLADAEILIISTETKAFLSDQISQVFTVYIAEYFQKEFTHLKFQYQRCLSRAISEDHITEKYLYKALTTTTVLSSLTTLKAEKLKNIPNIERTIGNHEFVDTVFTQTSDTMARMMNIARDDKKLPSKIKDLYILHMKFLFESVFLPITTATTVFLLKQASASPQSSALPPIEFLGILGCIFTAIDRNRAQFSRQFSPFFSDTPNLMVVCQEARKASLHALMINAKESLVAWGVCVTSHIDKMLLSLQSKHDYLPQYDDDMSLPIISDGKIVKKGAIECTGACTHVCKAIVMVVQSVHYYRGEFLNLIDLKNALWKFIGRLLVGVLMSHIRRNKISQSGGRRLVKDLEEYFQILTLLEVTEILDLMYCLKEIAVLFITPSHLVAKVVIETLRHLDYRIVTALLCSRSDYGTAAGAVWVNELTSVYGSCGPTQSSFPWEDRRRHLALLHFKSAVAQEMSGGSGSGNNRGNNNTGASFSSSTSIQSAHLTFGPLTLRKSSAPLSASFIMVLKEMNFPNTAAYVYTQEVLANTSSSIGRIPSRNHHSDVSNSKSGRHHDNINSRYGNNNTTTGAISNMAQKGLKNLTNLVPVSTTNFIAQLVKESNERRLQMGLTMNNNTNGNESTRSEKGNNNNNNDNNGNSGNNCYNKNHNNRNDNDDDDYNGDDDNGDNNNDNDNYGNHDEQQQQQEAEVKRKKKKSSSKYNNNNNSSNNNNSTTSTTLAMLEKQKTKMMNNITSFFS